MTGAARYPIRRAERTDRHRFTVVIAGLVVGATGLLHLALAPAYLAQAAHVGVLFLAGGTAALVAAVRLATGREHSGWLIGGTVCAGMAVGYVLSRTVGLPGFREVGVRQIPGTLSLLFEISFLVLWTTTVSIARRSTPARYRR